MTHVNISMRWQLHVVKNCFSQGGFEQRDKYDAFWKICTVSLINELLKAAALQARMKNKDCATLKINYELKMKENRFFFLEKKKRVGSLHFEIEKLWAIMWKNRQHNSQGWVQSEIPVFQSRLQILKAKSFLQAAANTGLNMMNWAAELRNVMCKAAPLEPKTGK